MTIRFLIRILTCLLVMLTFGVSARSALADDPAPPPAGTMADDPAPPPAGTMADDPATPPAGTMADDEGGSAPAPDASAPDSGAADADAGMSPADASTSPAAKSADDGEAPVKSPAASDDDGATPAPTSVPSSTTAPAQPALVASATQPTIVARAAPPAPPPAAARVSAPRPSRVRPPTVPVASADGAVPLVASPDRAGTRALVVALVVRTRERSSRACTPKRAPVRRRWSYRSQLPSVAQDSAPVREPGGTGTAGASSGGSAGAASPASRLLGVVTGPPAFEPWWSHRWPGLASWRSTFVTSVLERPD